MTILADRPAAPPASPFTVEIPPFATRARGASHVVHVPVDQWSVAEVADGVRGIAGGLRALTGEVVGGDSWSEWCEPAGRDGYSEPFRALHVYVSAATDDEALRIARKVARIAGVDPVDVASVVVTLAGEWDAVIR